MVRFLPVAINATIFTCLIIGAIYTNVTQVGEFLGRLFTKVSQILRTLLADSSLFTSLTPTFYICFKDILFLQTFLSLLNSLLSQIRPSCQPFSLSDPLLSHPFYPEWISANGCGIACTAFIVVLSITLSIIKHSNQGQ